MNNQNSKHSRESHKTILSLRRVFNMAMVVVLTFTLVLTDALPLLTQPEALAAIGSTKPAQQPNFLVIMGDDIGWFNVSAYNRGMMGYKTPNIDSIADDGILFTDAYGEQSCTAGRASFITGQLPIRSGMTKVGLPGVPIGLEPEDPTLANLLKPLGYTSGQFGKNHLGDLNRFLPTAHGFDEFYGNLYHLNAEEEPENEDYPWLDKAYEEAGQDNPFHPRGVLHSFPAESASDCPAGDKLHPYVFDDGIPKLADGITPDKNAKEYDSQCIQDTGALNIERMKTVDEDVRDRSIEFMKQAEKQGKPFFTWYNSTRMHVFTHLKDESIGISGQGIEGDGMMEHDQIVGDLLAYIDRKKERRENTIVVYTTDNGAEFFTWPDGGTTPFRNEKNSNWDGGVRVPMLVRWPGHIAPGQVSNDIISLLDWVPTLSAAAGNSHIKKDLLCEALDDEILKVGEDNNEAILDTKEKCLDDGRDYLAHLDGYNFLPYLTSIGKTNTAVTESPRKEFYYFTDDGYPSGLRYEDWKLIFSEQRAEGFEVWSEPFVNLRVPLIENLRRDPFEKAYGESDYYTDWRFRRTYLLGPGVLYMTNLLNTFKGYPPRQEPPSFTIGSVVKDLVNKLEQLYTFN